MAPVEPRTAPVTHDDVVAAAARIGGEVVHTPTARSRTLGEITGADVFVKFENLQFTASYKERGALNRLLLLPAGTGGVVTASAGNFGQGVAHHAGRLGLPATIVVPVTTPLLKIGRIELLGATVVRHGESFEEANRHAARLAVERDLVLLSPFDDADVVAGQGTVALELLDDVPDVEVLVIPTGGGGLLAGTVIAVAGSRPTVEVIGVQSERYPAVHNALTGATLPVGGGTIADGIAVADPGASTLDVLRRHRPSIELVAEEVIEEAIGLYLEVEKTVAEGAGAAPLAALLARPERYRGRCVGLVLSGGNIDLRQLASVTLRSLVRSGRLATVRIELVDRPGSLGDLTTAIGRLGGNIVEVTHQRLDLAVHARSTSVTVTIETAGRAHLERLLDELVRSGHHIRLPVGGDEGWAPHGPAGAS